MLLFAAALSTSLSWLNLISVLLNRVMTRTRLRWCGLCTQGSRQPLSIFFVLSLSSGLFS
ncbi:hypothetical protein BDV41DRAFT_532155 [Aspergillus transmontanensis]|uniref:Uncharacterized protein n=1 Tax=Aspergillus transmontanensis TaxID=1034304 RepID=A0A5N6W271_9EURO|nr:hypothetical protein BDV41DRAFT_532155 [Aspergillus transmontanensis]